MKYVIKEWDVNRRADRKGQYVSIKGRSPGVMSFILSLLGIEPTVSLEVYANRIQYSEGSLSGYNKLVIPMKNLSSIRHGLVRPLYRALGLAVIGLVIAGVLIQGRQTMAGLIAAPVAVLIAIIYYILTKRFSLNVSENAGDTHGFTFKASVIEGHRVDERAVDKVVNIVARLLEAQNAESRKDAPSPAARPEPTANDAHIDEDVIEVDVEDPEEEDVEDVTDMLVDPLEDDPVEEPRIKPKLKPAAPKKKTATGMARPVKPPRKKGSSAARRRRMR